MIVKGFGTCFLEELESNPREGALLPKGLGPFPKENSFLPKEVVFCHWELFLLHEEIAWDGHFIYFFPNEVTS